MTLGRQFPDKLLLSHSLIGNWDHEDTFQKESTW